MKIYSRLKEDRLSWLRFATRNFEIEADPDLFHLFTFVLKLVLVLLVQIENEYNAVQLSYKENGKKYVDWAADMATSLYNGVPWVMCKQKEAPPSIVSAQS